MEDEKSDSGIRQPGTPAATPTEPCATAALIPYPGVAVAADLIWVSLEPP